MSGGGPAPFRPLPPPTATATAAIPIGGSDRLERDVAAILGLDDGHFLAAAPIAPDIAPPPARMAPAWGRMSLVAPGAFAVALAAAGAFLWGGLFDARTPPRIVIAGPAPPEAPVGLATAEEPAAPAVQLLPKPAVVAIAAPVAAPVRERSAVRGRSSIRAAEPRLAAAPSPAPEQTYVAIAAVSPRDAEASPAVPEPAAVRLAQRAAPPDAAPVVPDPVAEPAAPVAGGYARAKVRAEAIDAIRMLRRQ